MVFTSKIPRYFASSRSYRALGTAFVLGGSLLTYKYSTAYAEDPLTPATSAPGVYLWGDNSKGLIATGAFTSASIKTPTRVPFLDNQKLKALAVCPDYALAALSNGDVIQWTSPEKYRTVLKSGKVSTLMISPKSHVAVALAQNGSIWTWQLNNPEAGTTPAKVQLDSKLGWFEKIVDVKCGVDHIVALTNKGRVYSGALQAQEEHYGQLGIAAFPHFEKLPNTSTLHKVKLLDAPVKQIACGLYHTLFLTEHGDLYGCGSNLHGQLLLPFTLKNTKISIPTKLSNAFGTVQAIGAGSNVSFFQSNDNAWFVAGDGQYGQFGTGSFAHCQVSPLKIAALDSMREYDEKLGKVVPMSVSGWHIGETHVFASISNAARDWLVWGSNEHGQIGNNKKSKVVKPVPVASTVVEYPTLKASGFAAGDKISGCYTADV